MAGGSGAVGGDGGMAGGSGAWSPGAGGMAVLSLDCPDPDEIDEPSGEGGIPAGSGGKVGALSPGDGGMEGGTFFTGPMGRCGRLDRTLPGFFFGAPGVALGWRTSRVKYSASAFSTSSSCTMMISLPGVALWMRNICSRERGVSLSSSLSSMSHHLSLRLRAFNHSRSSGSFIRLGLFIG